LEIITTLLEGDIVFRATIAMFIAAIWLQVGAHAEGLSADASPPANETALVAQPCMAELAPPAALAKLQTQISEKQSVNAAQIFALPEVQAFQKAQQEQASRDWPNLCRYRAANAALSHQPRVVFIGDSITEGWAKNDHDLFTDAVIGRGISGQTTPQILLRFYQDVINLHPRVVHIMAGTNDLAGNTGPSSEQAVKDNVRAMVQLAQANKIRVVLASIPPASAFPWRPALRPAAQIVELNNWLRGYARQSGSRYADYYKLLADSEGGFRVEFSDDGVHPNEAGYARMRDTALSAIGR
jgi:lysophospholipase L1-like esterase